MQYVRECEGLPVQGLIEFLADCDVPFQPSAIYQVASSENVIDPGRRVSVFRELNHPKVLEFASELVAKVSESDPVNTFALAKTQMTHVVYEEGGFFRPHQDFLSLVSNCVQEYSLLVCVSTDEGTKGGETRVEVGPGREIISRATTKPGCGLLFRKDLVHEGRPVTKGRKEIVMLDVWATRRAADGILLVTFPKEDEEKLVSAGAGPLKVIATGRSFAISTNVIRAIPTCMLNGKISFDASAATGQDGSPVTKRARKQGTSVPSIIRYECEAATYEEFETVYRVLHGMYLRPVDLIRHAKVLDFFGISPESALVRSVNAANAGGVVEESDDHPTDDQPQPVEPLLMPGSQLGLVDGLDQQPKSRKEECQLADESIIICTTDERAQIVADAAKQLNLPYARFRAIFARGTFSYSYGDPEEVSSRYGPEPVWVTVGDHENLFGFSRIENLDDCRIEARDVANGFMDKPIQLKPYGSDCDLTPGEQRALNTPNTLLFLNDGSSFDDDRQDYGGEDDGGEDDGREDDGGEDDGRKDDGLKGGIFHIKADTTGTTRRAFLGLTVAAAKIVDAEGREVFRKATSGQEQYGHWAVKPSTSSGDQRGIRSARGIYDVPWKEPVRTEPMPLSNVLAFLMPNNNFDPFPPFVAYPDGGGGSSSSEDTSSSAISPFFHIDAKGAVAFNAQEAEAASRHLIETGFLDELQARLARGLDVFEFPQEMREGTTDFCNEGQYDVKMDFIQVSGVVRLSTSTTSAN